jgi:hypothetical protein
MEREGVRDLQAVRIEEIIVVSVRHALRRLPGQAGQQGRIVAKRRMQMNMSSVVLGTCLLATAAGATELSWSELVRRPELWPAQCTLKRAVKFQGGDDVKAGETVDVLDVQPNELVLGVASGHFKFSAKPEETDVVAVANETWAKLTPAQRELTYASLLQRKDLWPYRVVLTVPLPFASNGARLERGDKVVLMNAQGRQLLVLAERIHAMLNVAPQQTDFMAQARKLVEEKQAAPGRVIGELEGKLISSTTGAPAPLDASALPRYVVFLRGSNTCPIPRRFMPTLVTFYKEMKPKHPEFEVIYVRADASVADMKKFAKEMGFSWRAVALESQDGLPVFGQTFGSKLPQLIVMDRSGQVLANGVQGTAPAALQQLRALLEKPSARN